MLLLCGCSADSELNREIAPVKLSIYGFVRILPALLAAGAYSVTVEAQPAEARTPNLVSEGFGGYIVFQTIEGGLGCWVRTQFGATTAKFRMNGTPNGYDHEIPSPGWGFGNMAALQPDQMGIAQLSSRLLVPPDGLTLKTGTCGDLLGYAWMARPLTRPKTTTAGLPVPTGNQCWTFFLNEVKTVPRLVSKPIGGVTYTCIPRLQFPADREGRTILIHKLTHYAKTVLYNMEKRQIIPLTLGRERYAMHIRSISIRSDRRHLKWGWQIFALTTRRCAISSSTVTVC